MLETQCYCALSSFWEPSSFTVEMDVSIIPGMVHRDEACHFMIEKTKQIVQVMHYLCGMFHVYRSQMWGVCGVGVCLCTRVFVHALMVLHV